MEKTLLVIILVLLLIGTISTVINTVLLTKSTKQEKLVLKVVKICAIIICVIGLLFAIVFFASDSDSNSSDKTTTTQTEDVALSEAGFNEVSLDEYLELIKKEENSIILVARPTCGYCVKFTPILKQAKDEMNLTVNYINTDNITSEEDFTKFENSLDYLKNEEWGTPLVLIVNSGRVIDSNSGYTELSVIKKFFTKNGFGE